MSCSGAAEKSQGVAEKNKEIVEANCTGFSAEFFGSVLPGKQKFKCWQEYTNVFLNP